MTANLDLFPEEKKAADEAAVASKGNRKSSGKSRRAYKTISEVSDEIGVAAHVLRFWETKFTQVQPTKRSGGRRYYNADDVDTLQKIRSLLYDEGYTIKGVQAYLKRGGASDIVAPSTGNGADTSFFRQALRELQDIRDVLKNAQ